MVARVDGFCVRILFHSAETYKGRGASLFRNHFSAESFSYLIKVQYQFILNNSLNIKDNWR